MDIQKLIESGYSLTDIQELTLLFQNNLKNYKDTLEKDIQLDIHSLLHKLKGGLRLLHCTDLQNKTSHIENIIKTQGEQNNKYLLFELIGECKKSSTIGLEEINMILAQENSNNIN